MGDRDDLDPAWSAATTAANMRMRKAGRTAWDEEDYALAVCIFESSCAPWRPSTFARLCPPDTNHCPIHPQIRLVTFCPACRGQAGGARRTEAQAAARKLVKAKGEASRRRRGLAPPEPHAPP